MARWTALSSIAALLVVVSPAWAQHLDPRDGAQPGAPPIDQRVHFALGFQGVPGCGERALFEDALRIQMLLLGSTWDPFAPVSRWPLKVRITRSNGWFEGVAEVYGPDGVYRGKHTMPGPLSCYDVIAGLTSALATDATPLNSRPKRPEPVSPKPKPAPAPEPACPESPSAIWPEPPPLQAPEPDPPKPAEAPLAFRFGTGVWADMISTDRSSLGLTLDLGVRYKWASVAGEVGGDPALGKTQIPTGGSFGFARVTGALLLCAHVNWFVSCLKGQGGRVLFPGSAPISSTSAPYGAAGVRLGLEAPVTPWFAVRVNGEMLAAIDPASVIFDRSSLRVEGWNAGLGVGALFKFAKH